MKSVLIILLIFSSLVYGECEDKKIKLIKTDLGARKYSYCGKFVPARKLKPKLLSFKESEELYRSSRALKAIGITSSLAVFTPFVIAGAKNQNQSLMYLGLLPALITQSIFTAVANKKFRSSIEAYNKNF